jgi:hypothetical protein
MSLAVVLRDVCAAMTSLQIPTLSGERLRLEPLASSHTEGMFGLWREPAVCEYSGLAIDAKGRLLELPAASSATSDRLLEFWLDRAQMQPVLPIVPPKVHGGSPHPLFRIVFDKSTEKGLKWVRRISHRYPLTGSPGAGETEWGRG